MSRQAKLTKSQQQLLSALPAEIRAQREDDARVLENLGFAKVARTNVDAIWIFDVTITKKGICAREAHETRRA